MQASINERSSEKKETIRTVGQQLIGTQIDGDRPNFFGLFLVNGRRRRRFDGRRGRRRRNGRRRRRLHGHRGRWRRDARRRRRNADGHRFAVDADGHVDGGAGQHVRHRQRQLQRHLYSS